MNTGFIFYLLAFLAGIMISIQPIVNNSLVKEINTTPIIASFFSFCVGAITLFLISFFSGQNFKVLSEIGNVSFIKLTGGVLGACFVFLSTVSSPKIGVASLLSLSIFAQIISSVTFDHYGLLGLDVRKADFTRILGVFFVILGVLLVNFKAIFK